MTTSTLQRFAWWLFLTVTLFALTLGLASGRGSKNAVSTDLLAQTLQPAGQALWMRGVVK